MKIEEALHDEIDEIEAARNEAARVVHDIVKNNLSRVLAQEARNIKGALEALTVMVEDEMTDLTTNEFRAGMKRGLRRYDARDDQG